MDSTIKIILVFTLKLTLVVLGIGSSFYIENKLGRKQSQQNIMDLVEREKSSKPIKVHLSDNQFPLPDQQIPETDQQFPLPDQQFPLPDQQIPGTDQQIPLTDNMVPVVSNINEANLNNMPDGGKSQLIDHLVFDIRL
jgi:hypothetical protein